MSMEKPVARGFIADVMVGSLARWLRILGFDVLYSNRYEDDEIVQIATAEHRIALTRDRGLAARFEPGSVILVEHDDIDSQMSAVLRQTGDNRFAILSRCVECNTPLERVDKEDVFEQIPPYVYLTQDDFARCPS